MMKTIKRIGEKLDEMGKWHKRIIVIGSMGVLILAIFNFGVAAKEHFSLGTRVLALEIDKRKAWLEEQDAECSKEERKTGKGGDEQSDFRKRNCKEWREELKDKYEELKKLQG
jgi:hypothetical protein